MGVNQLLSFDVKRILQFDVNRILMSDVGRALKRPITNPWLKAAAGWAIGVAVLGLGSMLAGLSPNYTTINLLAIAFGVVCAMTPVRRRRRSTP